MSVKFAVNITQICCMSVKFDVRHLSLQNLSSQDQALKHRAVAENADWVNLRPLDGQTLGAGCNGQGHHDGIAKRCVVWRLRAENACKCRRCQRGAQVRVRPVEAPVLETLFLIFSLKKLDLFECSIQKMTQKMTSLSMDRECPHVCEQAPAHPAHGATHASITIHKNRRPSSTYKLINPTASASLCLSLCRTLFPPPLLLHLRLHLRPR